MMDFITSWMFLINQNLTDITKILTTLKDEACTTFGISRAWRRELYTDLGMHKDEPYAIYEKVLGTNLGIEPLLSVRALKRKLRITEIPGDEPVRIGGERKLKVVKWGISYYLQILRELWYWK